MFRHLENTQNSQDFERAFQVQENGGTQGEIINLLKFVPLTTIGPFIDVIANKYFRINL